jgi:two-component system response regulator HydG
MKHILIVEDEEIIRSALKRLLERNGYRVSEAESVADALDYAKDPIDLIISDLRLPGAPGTDLITLLRPTKVLIMTSYASMKSAVDAMKLGAADYIAKPFDHDEMLRTVGNILLHSAQQESAVEAETPEYTECFGDMVGSCQAMHDLFHRIRKIAPADITVLIHGESGTGKELAAKAIHEHSPRMRAPLVSVNCAAIPESLIESELFGHEKGAFTGASAARQGLIEAAQGGTLFLDEIGELPMEAQSRLLRVLQESEVRRVGAVQSKKVDIRLIAATHRNLRKLVRDGMFREDLYYRLQVIEIKMPPLRDRHHDVIEIADALLHKQATRLGITNPPKINARAQQQMLGYDWPGNVRELENAVQRALILCEDAEITNEHMGIPIEEDVLIPDTLVNTNPPSNAVSPAPSDNNEDLSLEDYFQHFVLEHQDTLSETELAQKLGISRKNLWERRQKLGIPKSKKQPTGASRQ